MTLDAEAIRRHLDAAGVQVDALEVFPEIESTNTYLMEQPYLMEQSAPSDGRVRVALTDNQTAGRGRLGRTWLSPPGSGLCLSLAYRFASHAEELYAVTLAVGVSIVAELEAQGAKGVQLKWPNDLVVGDGKLGGILTEARTQQSGGVIVVTGVGLNVDLSSRPDLMLETEWAQRAVDLESCVAELPERNALAASLVSAIGGALRDYEAAGFGPFRERWQEHDWLRGKAIAVETPQHRTSGVAMGIADDGALLLDTGLDGMARITAGTVTLADIGEHAP